MIIESIRISNFGLYRGETFVKLSPDNLLNRNITVISGQNGVGKSTLQEAIHLCLLGSLSIDTRVSENNYERYLSKRSYKGATKENLITSIELEFEFHKSGAPVKYKVKRFWNNNVNDPNEDIYIEENGQPLLELNKKEKNLFLRELVQPGLARVMFFDGEKLLSLYDQGNLSEFISESCRYLFGLNFVDLLNTDLNYYINKLQALQDPSQSLNEILKVKAELKEIQNTIIALASEKTQLINNINFLKQNALKSERAISDQGRWATGTLEQLRVEKQQLEKDVTQHKKELIEVYGNLGPFVFCRDLCQSLKGRLRSERDIEKWEHASELLDSKLSELEEMFNKADFLNMLSISDETGRKLFPILKKTLLPKKVNDESSSKIYHEMADGERVKLLDWIDECLNFTSVAILDKSDKIARNEERVKSLTKELATFSKDDLITPLLKELQDTTRSIGGHEQKLESLNRRTDDTNKRRDFYSTRLLSLEEKLVKEDTIDERLKLSSRTKLVLESYAQQLMNRKLASLEEKVLEKFNLLCRKESYLDELAIDPGTFQIKLQRKGIIVDHDHLSAGEKQLLVVAILWGLRELTNIALPLIIDTPLARLDLEHRRTFIEQFLPAIKPQVILIGTDMELGGEVLNGLDNYIAHQYSLEYQVEQQATKLTEVERNYPEATLHEV